jgi:hypothetical protein
MKDINKTCNSISASPAELYTVESKSFIKFKLYIDEEEVDEIESVYNLFSGMESSRKIFGQAEWTGLEYIYNDEEYDYRLLLERAILYIQENGIYYDLIGSLDGLSFVKTGTIKKA